MLHDNQNTANHRTDVTTMTYRNSARKDIKTQTSGKKKRAVHQSPAREGTHAQTAERSRVDDGREPEAFLSWSAAEAMVGAPVVCPRGEEVGSVGGKAQRVHGTGVSSCEVRRSARVRPV